MVRNHEIHKQKMSCFLTHALKNVTKLTQEALIMTGMAWVKKERLKKEEKEENRGNQAF